MRMGWIMAVLAAAIFAGGCQSIPPRAAVVAPWQPDVARVDLSAAREAGRTGGEAEEAAGMAEEDLGLETGVLSRNLWPGDRVVVELRGIPAEKQFNSVIDEEGNINLPFIGRINVGGRTSAEAEKLIEKAYIDGGIYRQLSVAVIPPESEFYVRGYVHKPGSFPMSRNLTVLRAIAMAGGWNEFADPTRIRLIRANEVFTINAIRVERREDVDRTVEPGDVIVVPKRWM